ncbi:hypothetical protein CVS40_5369, partial [Lucilia cuprina]
PNFDVDRKINKARASFCILSPIWQSNKISLRTKLRIFKANKSNHCFSMDVQPGNNTHRLQTFENRCLRRILRILWPKTISNSELLSQTGQKPIESYLNASGSGLNILCIGMMRMWPCIEMEPFPTVRSTCRQTT